MKKLMALGLAGIMLLTAVGGTSYAADNRSGSGNNHGNSLDSRIAQAAADAVAAYMQSAPMHYIDVFNVKTQYNASGNGVNDDTSKLQQALDAARDSGGGIVYLPKGTYRTTDQLYVYSNTKLLGNQAKISRFDGPEDKYSVIEIAANQSNVTIEGLTVDNNKPGGNIGIDLAQNAQKVWIQNNTFTGINAQGVNINNTGVKHVQVSGNHFEQVSFGILTNQYATDLTDLRIVNNQFIDIIADGIELNHPGTAYNAADNIVIAGNYISVPDTAGSSEGAGFGIGIAGATHVSITGNIIENARYEGIHIEDEAKHISIVGNIINGVQASPDFDLNSGIYVIDGDFITISGNSIYNSQDYGVHLEFAANNQATHTVITGNTIANGKAGGIRISGFTGNSDIIVSQNIVTDNAGDGIQIGGDVQHIKVTDNIVRNNAGYGLYLESSGRGMYLSGNTLIDNTSGDIGVGQKFHVPVPLRGNSALVTDEVQVTAGQPETNYTDWMDTFSLGSGAEGVLYASATMGAARSTKIYKISWDGQTLTATQVAHDISGALEFDMPRVVGNKLQVQAYSGNSGTVTFDVQFEGIILLK